MGGREGKREERERRKGEREERERRDKQEKGKGRVEEKKGRGEREESKEWRMVMKCELHYYGMQYLPINHNVLNT